MAILLLLLAMGSIYPLQYLVQLWQVDADGLSRASFSDKLPEWDFTNLWFGAKLAGAGRVAELFDVEAYRAALRATLGVRIGDSEWSYPPSLLLFGAPFSLLPLRHAYIAWTVATLALLGLSLYAARLPRAVVVAALVSPAVLMNVLLGHNGALTAALLIGGLMLADRRPLLAGVLFGLLTVKPHLGLLIPFCLLASRNWRAVAAATVTAAALAVATGLAYGFEVWPQFWTSTRPLMTTVLEAPYPTGFQVFGVTVFLFVRSLGADLTTAYLAQAAAFAAAAALTWRLWSRPAQPASRMAATVVLGLLATPYAYAYDMVAFSVAVLVLAAAKAWRPAPGLALTWVWPGLVAAAFTLVGPVTPVVVALTAWMALHACRTEPTHAAAAASGKLAAA